MKHQNHYKYQKKTIYTSFDSLGKKCSKNHVYATKLNHSEPPVTDINET